MMLQHYRSYQFDYLFGWRYILSAKFRDQVRRKWGGNQWLRFLCATGGFISMLVSSTVFVFLLMAVWYLLTTT